MSKDARAEEDIEAEVDEFIKPHVEMRDFSGAILMAREGRISVRKAYGMANYELGVPNTPQTKSHVASITKTFTAAAIMMLQEERLLSVDDPIDQILPDYPRGELITPHHLLSHTSGIPNYDNFPDYNERMLRHSTLEETVAWFRDKPLEFEPGERRSYSNSNYVLLAHLIEAVSGESYEEFMQENIFHPLGMEDTGNFSHEAIVKNRAGGYAPGPNGLINAVWYDKSFKMGSGSLYSTVEDLYKWDRALYTDRLLKKSSLERMYAHGYGWGREN
ncbi:MAG: serine hydrolase domain-containing protein, partial [Candidatus Bathyarchaeia archaeon]